MERPKYLDANIAFNERVKDLISKLSLEEKITQLTNMSFKIERLGIPEYDWRNECLHGVARAGIATVFPQAIGLAATWNIELIHEVAEAISIEARAKYNNAIKENNRTRWYGLTFAAPNINIFRDPRWGRGQETFGEDPYLTTQTGLAFVKGLQGNHPKYLRAIAEIKHFAVHSGPERLRRGFNIKDLSKKDLWETYLPAFRACIKKGKAFGVMGAYNRLYGEPCSASKLLLQEILKSKWKHQGYVISDGGAIEFIHKNHKIVKNLMEAVAMALSNGCDIINPLSITEMKVKRFHKAIMNGVKNGSILEETINSALERSFMARFKLGMFDPPELVPFNEIPFSKVGCREFRELALQTARESIILLKNENNLLPLDKNINRIAVVGPNATGIEPLRGNYYGTSLKYTDPLEGIRNKVSSATKVQYAKGCDLNNDSKEGFNQALKISKSADVIILFLGLTAEIEGEEGEVLNLLRGDKRNLKLPGVQEDLLELLYDTGTPIILVLTTGSPVNVEFAKENIPAILNMWYAGEEGGNAIADVIFGDFNPSGKLPVTFYKSIEELPEFSDYTMQNRTYRYIKERPAFPFGYGLSYTSFEYSDLSVSYPKLDIIDHLIVKFKIKNIGNRTGQDVAQLYISLQKAGPVIPKIELKRFQKINLESGEEKEVSFKFKLKDFSYINEKGNKVLEPINVRIFVGGGQPNQNFEGYNCISCNLDLVGEKTILD